MEFSASNCASKNVSGHLSESPFNLWRTIYVGCPIYICKPELITALIMSWAELTRRSINHTGQAIGFSFDYLWNYTNALNETDPRSQSLFHPHGNLTRLCLTYDACVAEVGADNVLYSRRDVYDRVLLWRVPLIALVATTTLPALVSMVFSS